MARRPTTRVLTPLQAARAITIDFEGLADHRPVLLGSLWIEGKGTDSARVVLRHDHLEKPFRSVAGLVDLAGYHRYESQRSTLERAITTVVDRAERQRRFIVGWSHHELEVVGEYLSADLVERFEMLYRDAKATARRWTTAKIEAGVEERRPASNTLEQYMVAFGLDRPADDRIGGTADRIRRVEKGLATRRAWDLLLPSQQDAWRGVLHHNAADCEGTRAVALASARLLAGEEARC